MCIRDRQHRAPGRTVTGGNCGQLVRNGAAQQDRVGEDGPQSLNLAGELVALLFEFEARELGQAAQLQVEDVARLQLGQVEDTHQPRLGGGGVVGGADELDDLIDVEDRDEQALDEVQLVLAFAQPVCRAAAHDLDAEVDEDLQELFEAERAGLALDERDIVCLLYTSRCV